MLLVYNHFLFIFDIPYDIHLIYSRPLFMLLIGLLVHEAELLLLLAKHLLMLCLCLLKYIVVPGADLVLEELLVGVLVIHEHEIRLLLLFRQLQLVPLLLQSLQLHFQALLLCEEAHPSTFLKFFRIECWKVIHEAIVIRNHLLLHKLLG